MQLSLINKVGATIAFIDANQDFIAYVSHELTLITNVGGATIDNTKNLTPAAFVNASGTDSEQRTFKGDKGHIYIGRLAFILIRTDEIKIISISMCVERSWIVMFSGFVFF